MFEYFIIESIDELIKIFLISGLILNLIISQNSNKKNGSIIKN